MKDVSATREVLPVASPVIVWKDRHGGVWARPHWMGPKEKVVAQCLLKAMRAREMELWDQGQWDKAVEHQRTGEALRKKIATLTGKTP